MSAGDRLDRGLQGDLGGGLNGDLGDEEIRLLEHQLADLDVGDSDAAEVLARLAEAVFPGRVGLGDPGRLLWPEPGRPRANGSGGAAGSGGTRRRVGPSGPREQLEAQIRQSEARFRSLVEQLPAVVFYAALGDEANEAYVSPQIESLLGFTQEEWLTNPLLWYSQLHPDDHLAVIEAFTLGVQTGQPFRTQVRFFSRQGDEVWILGEARLIRDESGRPAYFQGVAFDVTMTKRAQEAMAHAERSKAEAAQLRAEAFAARNTRLRQLNKELRVAKEAAEAAAHARSIFLATMSHELRTPLNSVIVLAGLLANEGLTPSQQDMVRRMQRASDHLLEMINDVLEFSRLRAGQVELDRRTFDLVTWIYDTLDIVAPRASEKGLELRVVVGDGVPRIVTADQGRLRQVLLNLLANAVKFTAEGFVEVRVTAEKREDGRWEFECAVRDTGIGIRREDAAGLFDEFRQADSGIAREFGGTGLGLAICKRLCELLDGRIWVEEAEGAGATVIFSWIAGADGESTRTRAWGSVPESESEPGFGEVPVPAPAAGAAGTGGGPAPSALRILIAEDNLMNQQVALLLLAAMGHAADVVGNGDEVIAAVLAAPYDVVLMDVAMPGTDGLSATRAIRSLGGDAHQPYIVALTAHAFPGDAESCIEAGMDDYVAKPIDRAQLARALAAGAERAAGRSDDTPTPARSTWPSQPTGPAESDDDGFDPSLPTEILTEFGPGPLSQLVAIFRSEATRLVDAASAAVATGEIEQAEMAAHRLKSSAANLGARGLYASCAHLEALARSGSLDGAAALPATMAEQLAAALRRLDEIVSSPRNP
ncbi:MAG: ATP-binding protein [Actinomycetota bacterium]|nr:ATP-binding protein [Actinomycetota bacterium]